MVQVGKHLSHKTIVHFMNSFIPSSLYQSGFIVKLHNILGTGEPFNDVLVSLTPVLWHEVNAVAVKTPRDVPGQWVFGQDLGNILLNL